MRRDLLNHNYSCSQDTRQMVAFRGSNSEQTPSLSDVWDIVAPSPTGQTRPSSTTTARCWKATTSVLRTASCRTTMKWTSSSTSPKTTGGRWDWREGSDFCLHLGQEVRFALISWNLIDLFSGHENVVFSPQQTALSFPSRLLVLPGSWGLWWWRWCWPQICHATSSRWRPWRTSSNNLRGQFHLRSCTIKALFHLGQVHYDSLQLFYTTESGIITFCLQTNSKIMHHCMGGYRRLWMQTPGTTARQLGQQLNM